MFPFEFNPTPPSPCTINLKIVQAPPNWAIVPEAGAVPTGALAAHTAGLVFFGGPRPKGAAAGRAGLFLFNLYPPAPPHAMSLDVSFGFSLWSHELSA